MSSIPSSHTHHPHTTSSSSSRRYSLSLPPPFLHPHFLLIVTSLLYVLFLSPWMPMQQQDQQSLVYQQPMMYSSTGAASLSASSSFSPFLFAAAQSPPPFSLHPPSTSSDQSASWSGRQGHCAVVSSDDDMLIVIGGQDASSNPLNDVYQYSDPTKGWSSNLASSSSGFPPRYNQACILYNKAIYVLGGASSSTQALKDVYVSTDLGVTWSSQKDLPREFATPGIVASGGKLWLLGMNKDNIEMEVYTTSDPSAVDATSGDTWTRVFFSSVAPQHRSHAVWEALGSNIFLFGGLLDDGSAQVDAWSFNTADSTWTSLPVAPGNAANIYSGHNIYNNAIIMIGGLTADLTASDKIMQYSPSGGWTVWTQASDMQGVVQPAVAVFRDTVLALGGAKAGGSGMNNAVYVSGDGYRTPKNGGGVSSSTAESSSSSTASSSSTSDSSTASSSSSTADSSSSSTADSSSSSSSSTAASSSTAPSSTATSSSTASPSSSTSNNGGNTIPPTTTASSSTAHSSSSSTARSSSSTAASSSSSSTGTAINGSSTGTDVKPGGQTNTTDSSSGSGNSLLPVFIVVPIVVVLIIVCIIVALCYRRRKREREQDILVTQQRNPDIETGQWLSAVANKQVKEKEKEQKRKGAAGVGAAAGNGASGNEKDQLLPGAGSHLNGQQAAAAGAAGGAALASGNGAAPGVNSGIEGDPRGAGSSLSNSGANVGSGGGNAKGPIVAVPPVRLPRDRGLDQAIAEQDAARAANGGAAVAGAAALGAGAGALAASSSSHNPPTPSVMDTPPELNPIHNSHSSSKQAQLSRGMYDVPEEAAPMDGAVNVAGGSNWPVVAAAAGAGALAGGAAASAATSEPTVYTYDDLDDDDGSGYSGVIGGASSMNSSTRGGFSNSADSSRIASASGMSAGNSAASSTANSVSHSRLASASGVDVAMGMAGAAVAGGAMLAAQNNKSSSAHPIFTHRILSSYNIDRSEIQLKHQIGRGGFGTVYSAEYRGLPAAVKVIDVDTTADILSAFEREVEIMCSIHNNRLIQVYGAVRDEKQPLLVMEYMERSSLFDCLHGKNAAALATAFTLQRKLSISIQILEGLTYMHSCRPPMLHTDIKSHNILVSQNYDVKLSDFGFAQVLAVSACSSSLRSIRDGGRSSQSGSNGSGGSSSNIGGTLAYLPPEALGEDIIPPDTSLDMYAVGVVLWELFTGKVPWANLSFTQILMQVGVYKKSLPISQNSIPLPIQSILKQLFQVDRKLRPSARETLKMLRDINPDQLVIPRNEEKRSVISEAEMKAIESTYA